MYTNYSSLLTASEGADSGNFSQLERLAYIRAAFSWFPGGAMFYSVNSVRSLNPGQIRPGGESGIQINQQLSAGTELAYIGVR